MEQPASAVELGRLLFRGAYKVYYRRGNELFFLRAAQIGQIWNRRFQISILKSWRGCSGSVVPRVLFYLVYQQEGSHVFPLSSFANVTCVDTTGMYMWLIANLTKIADALLNEPTRWTSIYRHGRNSTTCGIQRYQERIPQQTSAHRHIYVQYFLCNLESLNQHN